MTIQRLHQILKKRRINIREFAGCKLGVDTYGMMYKQANGTKLTTDEPSDNYVANMTKFLRMLQKANVNPVLVMDGRRLPAKAKTYEKRREMMRRRQLTSKSTSFTTTRATSRKQTIQNNQSSCNSDVVFLSQNSVHKVRQIAKSMKIDVINAPFEADAQLGWLSSYGLVDAVISEDADLLVYGCDNLIFKLGLNGEGEFFQSFNLPECLGIHPMDFDMDIFRHVCVLAGCDYLQNVRGIGICKALEIIKSVGCKNFNNIKEKIIERMSKDAEFPEDYEEGINKAIETFKHHFVFNTMTRKVQHLQTTPKEWKEEGKEFLGTPLGPQLELEIAMGIKDPHTLQELFYPDGQFSLDSEFPIESVWNPNYRKKDAPPSPPFITVEEVEEGVRLEPFDVKWKCPCGDEVYDNARDFKKHVKIMHDEKRFYCVYCGKCYSTHGSLEVHIRSHTGERPYKCYFCVKGYTTNAGLSNHIMKHIKERPYRCTHCYRTFGTMNSLRYHLSNHATGSFKCHLCEKRFNQLRKLVVHTETFHENATRCLCEICGKSCFNSSSLRLHKFTHNDAQKRFKCVKCNTEYDTLERLRRHNKSRRHLNGNRCRKCHLTFKTGQHLRRHVFKEHGKYNTHKCNTCGKLLSTAAALKRHRQSHTATKQFECPTCFKKFHYYYTMMRHANSHGKTFRYICNHCTKAFQTCTKLYSHKKTHIHTRDFICCHCLKGFKTAPGLNKHKRTHKKYFICVQCKKGFGYQSDLNDHKKTHADTREYICHQCKKGFKTKKVLEAHKTTHATTMDFICDLCSMRFTTKRNLKAHQKSHLTTRDSICDKCKKGFKTTQGLNAHKKTHTTTMDFICDLCSRRFNTKTNLDKHKKRHTQTSGYLFANSVKKGIRFQSEQA